MALNCATVLFSAAVKIELPQQQSAANLKRILSGGIILPSVGYSELTDCGVMRPIINFKLHWAGSVLRGEQRWYGIRPIFQLFQF